MQEKTRCIVLKTVKYGDQNLIIDMLTEEYGRMSVVWRKPRSGRGKIKKQYFQPLSLLEIVFDRRPSASLPLLLDAHIAEPYTTLQYDPIKSSIGFFIAEFLVMATRSEQDNAPLYQFIETSLVWLDANDKPSANFHLMFMMRISGFLGFYPDFDSRTKTTFFDMRAGEFCESAPLHSDFLQPEEARYVALLMRMTPANMHIFRFSQNDRNHIVELLLRYYTLHIPGFREMKSWEVLKAIYSPSPLTLPRGGGSSM